MAETEPVHLVENDNGDRFLIYNTARGVKVELRYQGERLWMTQAQMAEMFGRDVSVVSRHISAVLDDGELSIEGNLQKLQIAPATRPTTLYSLDMVISVAYRVTNSKQATLLRMWATDKLVQFATKGFVVDKERLKDPANFDRVRELREIIAEIRADEANTYAELKRICAMAQDYDGTSKAARDFYAHMQAKLFHAVLSMTPSEVKMQRVNSGAPNCGLVSFPNDEIRQQDVLVAKNVLGTAELKELNRLTVILLDVFGDQLDIGKLVTMADAERLLDSQLRQLSRPVLRGGGSVKAEVADQYVKAQYKLFDEQRKLVRKAEADAALADLATSAKTLPRGRKSTSKPEKSNSGET